MRSATMRAGFGGGTQRAWAAHRAAMACTLALTMAASPANAAPPDKKPSGPLPAKAAPKPAPRPAPKWKPVVTKGWKADLPSDWTVDAKFKTEGAPDRGVWVYASPNRNLKVRVRVRLDRGEPIAKVVEENLKRLMGRSKDAKVVEKKVAADGYFAIVRMPMRRKELNHDYLVFRTMVRKTALRLRATLTFAGTTDRLEHFRAIVDRATATFDVLAKAPPPELAATPKADGKTTKTGPAASGKPGKKR